VEPLSNDLYAYYVNVMPFEIYEDANAFLRQMAERNRDTLRLGVITNFDKRVHNILSGLRLSQHFDFVICSEEAVASKPDRRIFDCALAAAGGDVDEAWHLGDDAGKDYIGAKDAGWNALLLDRDGSGGAESRVPAEDICQDLIEAKERMIIKGVNF